MRIFTVGIAVLGVCAFCSPVFAQDSGNQTRSDGKSNAAPKYDSVAAKYGNSPYAIASSPFYSAGGTGGPSKEELAAARAQVSSMSIDRKAYVDQIMKGFDAMDRNHDGKISGDELTITMPDNAPDEGLVKRDTNQPAPATAKAVKKPAIIKNGTSVGIPPINADQLNK